MTNDPARRARVLILARESVIAALLSLLLELEDYEPVFPEPGEDAEAAVRRVRPPLVVVLDGDLAIARSDLFFARAAQGSARVVLFSEPVSAAMVRALARARRLPCFTMPVSRQTLGEVLHEALEG